MESPAASLTTIFSNFGSKADVYDATGGFIFAGPKDSFTGQQQDVAMPFTPTKNSTIITIKVPFQYYGYGYNGGTIELAADTAGLPGKVLAKQDLKSFQNFGSGCCKLVAWKLSKSVKVRKGKQYWIIATTGVKSIDSADTWDYVWNGAIGPVALQDNGAGWSLLTFLPSPAAAVYGTIP
jgi:hypothetical protein